MTNTLTSAVSTKSAATLVGERAEARVFEALATLPPPWKFFHTVEWRYLDKDGEHIGETDAVVLHPQDGVVVLEIKGGEVSLVNGKWFFGSGNAMEKSPFYQARRNRYALKNKLIQRMGKDLADSLSLTHAVWFPDVRWQGPVVDQDAASRSFLLDLTTLDGPETALLSLLKEAHPGATPWTKEQQRALIELLAPDCRQLVAFSAQVDAIGEALHTATEQQVQVLRVLRTQPRLLVEGCAGSGKTVLAMALAREHAALEKRVLFTCYNDNLARHLRHELGEVLGITVLTFHDLARVQAESCGLKYDVPEDKEARRVFFDEACPELLMTASETSTLFDTIIVDEGADFLPTWFVALGSMGAANYSWYCFYDSHQTIFQNRNRWEPPFQAVPLVLDINLRNTRPVGEHAAQLGKVATPASFRVDTGPVPVVDKSTDYQMMAAQLRQRLKNLINAEKIDPEQIVVLSPYRLDNERSKVWAEGLNSFPISTDMARSEPGKVRAGTIQSFKGLEADVIILAGLDAYARSQPQLLYVGASRARTALFILELEPPLSQLRHALDGL